MHRGAFGAAFSSRSVFAVCHHELMNSRGTTYVQVSCCVPSCTVLVPPSFAWVYACSTSDCSPAQPGSIATTPNSLEADIREAEEPSSTKTAAKPSASGRRKSGETRKRRGRGLFRASQPLLRVRPLPSFKSKHLVAVLVQQSTILSGRAELAFLAWTNLADNEKKCKFSPNPSQFLHQTVFLLL